MTRNAVHGSTLTGTVRRIVVASFLAVTGPASTHHSIFAVYDDPTYVEVDGVITALDLRNPHITMTMEVDSGSGTADVWHIEGDSANALARRGISVETLGVGERVRIAGYPSKFHERQMLATNMLLPDGQERLLTERPRPWRWTPPPPPASTAPATETELGRTLFRVWSFDEFLEPRVPPVFTAAALAAQAAWDPSTDMLALRCIPPGMPNAMHSPYPIEFVDEGDRIRLRIEEWEATRLIDMVATAVPDDAPPTPYGYSVGRWEGDTLVVETARIDFPYFDDLGTPMSDQVRMRERFTLSEDGNRLDYELTVTDPPNLVEPTIWDAAWVRVPGTRLMPYQCTPG